MSNGFHFVGDTLQNVNLCGKWIEKFMSRLLKLTIYCDFVITNVIPRSMIFANFKEKYTNIDVICNPRLFNFSFVKSKSFGRTYFPSKDILSKLVVHSTRINISVNIAFERNAGSLFPKTVPYSSC